jgi:deoxyribodipyrimidine photo-lyase
MSRWSFLTATRTMAKRSRSSSPSAAAGRKKLCADTGCNSSSAYKFATADNAAAVDSDPPLPKLLAGVQNAIKNPAKGDSVVYWMRMADLRSAHQF